MIEILKCIAAIFLLIVSRTTLVPENLKAELTGAGIMLLIIELLDFIVYLWKNRKRLSLIIGCKKLAFKKQCIRFSMSYQYRIKVNDKYLLVKNSNWNFYKHVGGKYKRIPSSQKILDDLGAKDDLILQTTGLKKDDLAVFIPAKNAIKFMDWFHSNKDREVSHFREFYEELLGEKSKVLNKNHFPYVDYKLVGTVTTPLKQSQKWDCWEILQYDVIDLLPTPKQQKELEHLFNKGDTDYIKWADDDLIQRLGHDSRSKQTLYEIGAHAKWVVNLKWS